MSPYKRKALLRGSEFESSFDWVAKRLPDSQLLETILDRRAARVSSRIRSILTAMRSGDRSRRSRFPMRLVAFQYFWESHTSLSIGEGTDNPSFARCSTELDP